MPGLAAIERAENAALGIRTIRMPEGGDENAVRILGIDEDRSNLLRVAQSAITLSQMLPSAARVGRFVDTVAYGKIRPAQAFAAADINRVRIRRRDCQSSNRTSWLTIENRIPGLAEVRRFPNSAVVRRHVEDIRLARNAGNRHRASAAKRADHAPAEFLVHSRVILLGGKRERKEQHTEQGEQNPQESLIHSWSSKRGKDKPRQRRLDSAVGYASSKKTRPAATEGRVQCF